MSEFPYTGDTEQRRLPHAEIPGCALVQDLIPLYLDGEVSPDSHALIAEHVGRCERCSGYLAGARTVRAQILNEQQQVRAASAVNPTVEQVRTPVANSFIVTLWQSVMGLLYLGGLLVMFIAFAASEAEAILLSGMMLIAAIAGLLLTGSARTNSWRVLMWLTSGMGLLFAPFALADGGPDSEVVFLYSLGVFLLGMWGRWLHKKQQPPSGHQPLPRTRRLRLGAHRAMLTAFLSVIGAVICGMIAIGSSILLVQGMEYGWPDQVFGAGIAAVLSIGGIAVINHHRRWAPIHVTQLKQLIGMALVFFGLTLLITILPGWLMLGNAWFPSVIGVGLVFAGLHLVQRERQNSAK